MLPTRSADRGVRRPVRQYGAGMDPVHGGEHIIDAARAAGVSTVFSLSGAHIFPVYDAAVGGKDRVEAAPDRIAAERGGPLRLVDTRHEQTAVFAAEATGRLTRAPGFAAVTAGPGVTNAVSGIATAHFNGTPMVVLGGRSPDSRWGEGALQELDQPPILAPITKGAWTTHDVNEIRADGDRAFALAAEVHSGPVFWDIPIDVIFAPAPREERAVTSVARAAEPDPEAIASARALLDEARHPVVILGSGVWMGDAVDAARALVVVAQPSRHRERDGPGRDPAQRSAPGDPCALSGVQGRGPRHRRGHATRLPARVRHLRGPARARHPRGGRRGRAVGSGLGRVRARRGPVDEPAGTGGGGPRGWGVGRVASRCGNRGGGGRRSRPGERQQPDPSRADLRRAAAEADAGFGRHRRRRRLRLLRRPVHRAGAARPLAGPGAVRVPRHGARLRAGGGPRPPPVAAVPADGRRGGRLLADGRRLAGPASDPGRHDRRQQRGLGAREAADAAALRV